MVDGTRFKGSIEHLVTLGQNCVSTNLLGAYIYKLWHARDVSKHEIMFDEVAGAGPTHQPDSKKHIIVLSQYVHALHKISRDSRLWMAQSRTRLLSESLACARLGRSARMILVSVPARISANVYPKVAVSAVTQSISGTSGTGVSTYAVKEIAAAASHARMTVATDGMSWSCNW